MAVKHRRQRRRVKRVATLGAATATVTALTVGVAPPPAQAAAVQRDFWLSAATGPDYTQLITDSSNSLNNILFAAGNFGNAAANVWNPVANAVPGGLLPTFFAGTEQQDLTSIAGLLGVLGDLVNGLTSLNLDGIPGLPADADTAILAGLVPGLAPAAGVLASTLAALGPLIPVATFIDYLNGLNAILQGLDLPLIGGIPTLDSLIDGLVVSNTTHESGFSWPILGGSGETTVTNLFAQLPSLTVGDLVTGILDGLVIAPASDLVVGGLIDAAANLLEPLDAIETPSVTAWVPGGSGNYKLLGAEYGWLATMPTLAVGPFDILGVGADTDTVVAIPIFAQGGTLPFGLFSMGMVTTPGAVFPTATGLSTLGGTTLFTAGIPALGLSYTSLNLLQATYVGTNGFNVNSGTTVGTLVTPFGAIPIVYSLGSYNAGSTGFGFTLPSLFTVGLAPHFQVGTAPLQQSDDGLIPATLLNLGITAVPTQLTSVTELLGLPDVGGAVSDVLTPVFNFAIAPIGGAITNALNEQVGPVTNGLASAVEQVTGFIADLSYNLPGANTPVVDPPGNTALVADNSLMAKTSAPADTGIVEQESPSIEGATKKLSAAADDARGQVHERVTAAGERAKASAEKARERTAKAVKDAQDRVNKLADEGRKQIKSAAEGIQKGAEKAVNDVKENVKKAGDSVKPAKAEKKTEKKDAA
ncbi:hypothetical protein ACT17_12345 [Mycolicibacterium conceptionense]|jgi:hypothetical protein|uniref:ATPase n=1 Tax=Mycolicibacterium conceptionense TaxID=451644 RepID=A0A0J8UAT2_9MYCO|nr:hypothetical protein ACT17_12345 [Mycolicibacterium conceptionense]OBK02029.1 hypothetical protein A5639_25205 [Mycolicibacterium conceptionense]OMB77821.1 hypothetical protein A5746_09280 [Mycolicibacterium conceptionense]OMB87014.1 hypothetical protein A5741_16745 [Mycolicibacterium conceptionense]ORV20543.1 hypothetical protein AWB98_29180 [Mycolicibacterium conceptionense]